MDKLAMENEKLKKEIADKYKALEYRVQDYNTYSEFLNSIIKEMEYCK